MALLAIILAQANEAGVATNVVFRELSSDCRYYARREDVSNLHVDVLTCYQVDKWFISEKSPLLLRQFWFKVALSLFRVFNGRGKEEPWAYYSLLRKTDIQKHHTISCTSQITSMPWDSRGLFAANTFSVCVHRRAHFIWHEHQSPISLGRRFFSTLAKNPLSIISSSSPQLS